MKTSVLLVGVGGYGTQYVHQLLEHPERDDVRVAGVVDPFAEKSPMYPQLKARGIPFFDTLSAFYAAHTADLAVISTPIPLHAEQAIFCMRAGSHVLLEKPIAATGEQARAMIAERDASGKMLAIGFQWCWDEAMQRLRDLVRSGELGAPRRLRALVIWPRDFAYYSRGSGWAGKAFDGNGNPIYDSVASNATAHYLFNMLWLSGRAPVSCQAQTYKANAIDTYDTAFLKYQLQGGAEALFIATHATRADQLVNPCFLYEFERGTVTFGEANENHILVRGEAGERDLGPSRRDYAEKLWRMVGAIRGEEAIACTAEDAALHLRAIELAREAEPQASAFAHGETDGARAWSPDLYSAALKCYESFQLPREAGLKL